MTHAFDILWPTCQVAKEYLDGVKKEDVGQLPTVLKILQIMQPNLEASLCGSCTGQQLPRDSKCCKEISYQTISDHGLVHCRLLLGTFDLI